PALSFANPSAFDFHFPDDGAWAPDSSSLAPSRISMATWVRFDSLTNRGKCGGASDGLQYLMFRRNSSAGNGITGGVALIKQSNNTLGFVVQDGNGVRGLAPSTTIVQTGRWYHVVGTYDGSSQVRLYVNGMPDGADTQTSGIAYDRSGRFYLARSGE